MTNSRRENSQSGIFRNRTRHAQSSGKLKNKSFYLRLNVSPNAADAVANDVRYHLKCQVKIQPLIDPKKDLQELDDFKQVASDIELTSFAKYKLSNPVGLIMDMNTLNETY